MRWWRGQLVGLNLADVATGPDRLTITLRRSKTGQEGAGRVIGVPFGSASAVCPVRALAAWITVAGITEGAIFRGVSRHGALLGRLRPPRCGRRPDTRRPGPRLLPACRGV